MTSRWARSVSSVALAAAAIVGCASGATGAAATLTLSPAEEVASPAGNYLDATLSVGACFTGVTGKIFWGTSLTPTGVVVDPPCSGQTMTVFFSHVAGPGPSPGDTVFTAGLWADGDTLNLHAYAAAQAMFKMDAPPQPTRNPGPAPASAAAPASAPPEPVATPLAESPSPSPTVTPCAVMTAATIRNSGVPGPHGPPAPPAAPLPAAALLVVAVLLFRPARRVSAATVLALALIAVVSLSCGRYPPNAASRAPTPPASQSAPSPSPTC